MKTINNYALFGMILFLITFSDVSLTKSVGKAVTFLPQAEAIVGRPLTPVSVAGVARRTVRRCAVGVYYCQRKPVAPTKISSTQKS